MSFFRLDPFPDEQRQELFFEGQPLQFSAGDTVAGVLLSHGINEFRKTPLSGSSRGPWCLMGVCFECLVSIDGNENQRACMTAARAGMQVRRQIGPRHDAAGEKS